MPVTDRLVGHDVGLFSISGVDVLALYSSASIRFSANEIDLTAALDDWATRRTGTRDWEISCTKFIETSSSFLNMIVTGGQAAVSCDIGGRTFSAIGNVVDATVNTGTSEQSEDATVRGYGDIPTITPI